MGESSKTFSVISWVAFAPFLPHLKQCYHSLYISLCSKWYHWVKQAQELSNTKTLLASLVSDCSAKAPAWLWFPFPPSSFTLSDSNQDFCWFSHLKESLLRKTWGILRSHSLHPLTYFSCEKPTSKLAYKNIEVHDWFYIFLTQKRELAACTRLQNKARVISSGDK